MLLYNIIIFKKIKFNEMRFLAPFHCQLYKTILKYLILVVIHWYIFFIGSSLYSLILYILYAFEATTCLCHSRVTCKYLLCKMSIIIGKLNTLINCSVVSCLLQKSYWNLSRTISNSKVPFLYKIYVIEQRKITIIVHI